MATIAVIDYGSSNLRSVVKAIETVVGGRDQVVVTDDTRRIRAADRVVFPGQGAIGNCMSELDAHRLVDVIRESARQKPFLGICLGLQSLMETSDEDGGTPCLGLYAGGVHHFPANPAPAADGSPRKIPHMGWNEVRWKRPHPVTAGIADCTRFYFVHSYYVEPAEPALTIGETDYIQTFTAALAEGMVFATQFHPEKSAAAGLRLLRNFVDWDGGL